MRASERGRWVVFITVLAALASVAWIQAMGPRSTTAGAPSSHPTSGVILDAAGRLRIPTLEVDAPILVADADTAGQLEAPAGPLEVLWYDITARPGTPGTALLAGHLNWRDGTTAVFARLVELKPDDTIEIGIGDRSVLHYRVTSVSTVDAWNTTLTGAIASDDLEGIALITCAGEYLWDAGTYAQRTIVHARRVL